MARQFEHRTRGDVITVPTELEKKYDEHPDWKRHTSASSGSSSRPARKSAAKKTTAKKAAAPNPSSTSSS